MDFRQKKDGAAYSDRGGSVLASALTVMNHRFNRPSFVLPGLPGWRSSALGQPRLAPMALASLLLCSSAFAEQDGSATDTAPSQAGPAPEARPKMNLTVPPEEAPVQRSAYVHNGFYLRVGVGPSYMYSSLRDKSRDNTTDAHSFAVSADLLVGGSPSPGMTLGGGALVNLAPSASFAFGKEFLFHFTAGPFFDAFPNNREGFHLGTLLGFSGLSVNEEIGMLAGGGGAAWLGYDMWVAPEWSAGVHAQLGGSFHGSSDYSAAVFHASLMLTVLRH